MTLPLNFKDHKSWEMQSWTAGLTFWELKYVSFQNVLPNPVPQKLELRFQESHEEISGSGQVSRPRVPRCGLSLEAFRLRAKREECQKSLRRSQRFPSWQRDLSAWFILTQPRSKHTIKDNMKYRFIVVGLKEFCKLYVSQLHLS